MNSKQLIVFQEVMRTGSFSEASRTLHRTQPAISAMIASLEEDLGYRLFLRHAGRLVPVPEAHYLLEECNEILERMRTVEESMRRIGDLEQGVLRIASMPGPSVILMPQLLTRFLADRKDVRLTLLTRNSDQVRHLIATQKFDLGLADLDGQHLEDTNLLLFRPVTYDCVCALAAHDPLAEREVITPQDLAGRDMAALFAAHSTYLKTQAAFAAYGIDFAPRFETQYFYPLLSFVEAGLACAIIDPLSAESYKLSRGETADIVFRPFRPAVSFNAAIVTPRHRPMSKLAEAFAKILTQDLERLRIS